LVAQGGLPVSDNSIDGAVSVTTQHHQNNGTQMIMMNTDERLFQTRKISRIISNQRHQRSIVFVVYFSRVTW
jgi:hypothetical protein